MILIASFEQNLLFKIQMLAGNKLKILPYLSYFRALCDCIGTGSGTTTEYVSIDGETALGPELPMIFDSHCATKINDSLVILTGGFGNHGETLLGPNHLLH